MILMAKLRLDSPLQEFAYKFDASVTSVSHILLKWLAILDTKLKPLMKWPEREVLWIGELCRCTVYSRTCTKQGHE